MNRPVRGAAAAAAAGAIGFLALHFVLVGHTTGLHFEPRESTLYRLPWQTGASHRCVQGNQTRATHRGAHATAWDFWMWPGTPVHAARSGIVEKIADGYPDRPGWRPGNRIRVRHADGSSAIYAHLRSSGMRVVVGQAVAEGDLLGEAGMSGRTLYPHLHFQVRDARDASLAVSFRDVDAAGGIPRIWRRYTASH